MTGATDQPKAEGPRPEYPPDETARLREQVLYLQAAARELVAQRDALGERAANLAGELAVLKARAAGDGAAPETAREDPAGPA
jgi:hypothetical protein